MTLGELKKNKNKVFPIHIEFFQDHFISGAFHYICPLLTRSFGPSHLHNDKAGL
jgi:hypothetical protein